MNVNINKNFFVYPVSNLDEKEVLPDEFQVYTMIVRHFTASISSDAIFCKTETTVWVGEEIFVNVAVNL